MEEKELKHLNKALSSVMIDARMAYILNKFNEKALVTTSFGTTSALLLHILSRVKPASPFTLSIPVICSLKP